MVTRGFSFIKTMVEMIRIIGRPAAQAKKTLHEMVKDGVLKEEALRALQSIEE